MGIGQINQNGANVQIQGNGNNVVFGNNNTVNDTRVLLALLDVIREQAATIGRLQESLFSLQMEHIEAQNEIRELKAATVKALIEG